MFSCLQVELEFKTNQAKMAAVVKAKKYELRIVKERMTATMEVWPEEIRAWQKRERPVKKPWSPVKERQSWTLGHLTETCLSESLCSKHFYPELYSMFLCRSYHAKGHGNNVSPLCDMLCCQMSRIPPMGDYINTIMKSTHNV
jgi:hypothetical protein